jgi:uncharacterized DUF497 family protein
VSVLRFTWNAKKAAGNLRKHGVSFDEAATVFVDPLARIHDDPDHSFDEQREIIVGTSETGRLLLVCFTQRGEIVRIINARSPDGGERMNYEEGW